MRASLGWLVGYAIVGTAMNDDASIHPFPNTHWSLVRQAGCSDEDARRKALSVLVERYQPALRSYLCVARRMSPTEAEELLQGFIADRILEHELCRHARAKRGRFRALLITSLKNYAISRIRAQKIRATVPLPSAVDNGASTAGSIIEAAWVRSLICGVIAAMRVECEQTGRDDVWAVFEGRILAELFGTAKPVPYSDLARRLALKSPMQAANLLVLKQANAPG